MLRLAAATDLSRHVDLMLYEAGSEFNQRPDVFFKHDHGFNERPHVFFECPNDFLEHGNVFK